MPDRPLIDRPDNYNTWTIGLLIAAALGVLILTFGFFTPTATITPGAGTTAGQEAPAQQTVPPVDQKEAPSR